MNLAHAESCFLVSSLSWSELVLYNIGGGHFIPPVTSLIFLQCVHQLSTADLVLPQLIQALQHTLQAVAATVDKRLRHFQLTFL